MSIINVDVSVNIDNLSQHLNSVVNSDAVMTQVHQKLADIVDPWIPYDTGNMSQEEISIDANGVTYYADYAFDQYYNMQYNHNTEHHPLATARWDKVALQTEGEHFSQEVADIIARNFNGQK